MDEGKKGGMDDRKASRAQLIADFIRMFAAPESELIEKGISRARLSAMLLQRLLDDFFKEEERAKSSTEAVRFVEGAANVVVGRILLFAKSHEEGALVMAQMMEELLGRVTSQPRVALAARESASAATTPPLPASTPPPTPAATTGIAGARLRAVGEKEVP